MKRFCICLLIASGMAVSATGTTYYVSSSAGNDSNNGVSSVTPWKTLAKASKRYAAGDQILLKCNDTWAGEKLSATGKGTFSNPILLSSYGSSNKPVLKRMTVGKDEICIDLSNPSGWKITNLKFDTGLFGLRLKWDGDYNNDYIWVEGCEFYNFLTGDFSNGYPAGIWFTIVNGDASKTYCSNITVKNCFFQDCVNGVDVYAFTGNNTFLPSYISYRNVQIYNCTGYSCGSCPIGVANTTGGNIHHNVADSFSDIDNSVGGCGGFLIWCKDLIVEHNEYKNGKRIGNDPDGCAFDFEAKNDNIIFLYNNIHDNAGCGIMLYNSGNVGGNTNIHILYNTFSNNGKNPAAPDKKFEITNVAGIQSGNIDSNTFVLAPGTGPFNNLSSFTFNGNMINGKMAFVSYSDAERNKAGQK